MLRLLVIIFLFFGLLWPIQNTLAQDSLTYRLSYMGNNLWNPGLKAGLGVVWKSKTTVNKMGKNRYHQISVDGNIGFYIDPNSHTGAFLDAGLTYRKFYTNNWFYSLGINPVGIYGSFLPETYEVSATGVVTKKSLPRRIYFAPSGSLGLGRLIKDSRNGWFVQTNLMLLMPYNTYILPLLNIEAGYSINLRK